MKHLRANECALERSIEIHKIKSHVKKKKKNSIEQLFTFYDDIGNAYKVIEQLNRN